MHVCTVLRPNVDGRGLAIPFFEEQFCFASTLLAYRSALFALFFPILRKAKEFWKLLSRAYFVAKYMMAAAKAEAQPKTDEWKTLLNRNKFLSNICFCGKVIVMFDVKRNGWIIFQERRDKKGKKTNREEY